MVLSFSFYNDLLRSPKTSWPEVVKKHCLTSQDLQKVSEIVKAGKLEDEWFNLLYTECLGGGLSKAEIVLEKYGIKDDGIKERMVKRWIEENNIGKGNN